MSFLQGLFGGNASGENLRIVITRHGERADLELGKHWARNMRQNGHHDPRVSYLTPRSNFHEWDYDPPLTVDGENQSSSVGRKLLHLGYPIDYCYSSPSYRSVQTATKILESQRRKAVPINIEPGLFECVSWYSGAPLTFIPPTTLAKDRHFNVNSYYTPIYDAIDPNEHEKTYYRRSRYLIRQIIRTHKAQGGTVLLSGHGGSIEAVTRGLRGILGRRARPEYLKQEAIRVNYCNFAILERDARTRQWAVRTPEQYNNPHGAGLNMQTEIPLYTVTAHHAARATQPNRQRQRQRQHRSPTNQRGRGRRHRS